MKNNGKKFQILVFIASIFCAFTVIQSVSKVQVQATPSPHVHVYTVTEDIGSEKQDYEKSIIGNSLLVDPISVNEVQFEDNLLENEKFYDVFLVDNNNTYIHALYGMESKKYVKLHHFGSSEECIACKNIIADVKNEKNYGDKLFKEALERYSKLSNKDICSDYSTFRCNNNYTNIAGHDFEIKYEGTRDEYYVCKKCGYTILSGINYAIDTTRFSNVVNMSLDKYIEKKGNISLLSDQALMSNADDLSRPGHSKLSYEYYESLTKKVDDNSKVLVNKTSKEYKESDTILDDQDNTKKTEESDESLIDLSINKIKSLVNEIKKLFS